MNASNASPKIEYFIIIQYGISINNTIVKINFKIHYLFFMESYCT